MHLSRLLWVSALLFATTRGMEQELSEELREKKHREIVASLIKTFGPGIVGITTQKKINANGWSPRIPALQPDRPLQLYKPKDLPTPLQKLSFFQEHKSALIVTAVAGIAVTALASYVIISAYKKISQDEWDKAHSWSDKISLIARNAMSR